jgi:hypothetical protein
MSIHILEYTNHAQISHYFHGFSMLLWYRGSRADDPINPILLLFSRPKGRRFYWIQRSTVRRIKGGGPLVLAGELCPKGKRRSGHYKYLRWNMITRKEQYEFGKIELDFMTRTWRDRGYPFHTCEFSYCHRLYHLLKKIVWKINPRWAMMMWNKVISWANPTKIHIQKKEPFLQLTDK